MVAKETANSAKAREKANVKASGRKDIYTSNYRAPDKGVGKGLNQLDDDWYNAWGSDYANDYENYEGGYTNWNNYGGSLGNVTMMLERRETGDKDEDDGWIKIATGEQDLPRHTPQEQPTIIHNRYEAFTNDDDSDDSDDEDIHASVQAMANRLKNVRQDDGSQNKTCSNRKHNPKQRRRKRCKELHVTRANNEGHATIGNDIHEIANDNQLPLRRTTCNHTNNYHHHSDNNSSDDDDDADGGGAVRDAAATDSLLEGDWIGVGSTQWHGPRCTSDEHQQHNYPNGNEQQRYITVTHTHIQTTTTTTTITNVTTIATTNAIATTTTTMLNLMSR